MDGESVIRVRSPDEIEPLIAPVVLAFSADPFVRWMLPGSDQFLSSFVRLTRSHGQRTASGAGAFARADGKAAAFWYPPGVFPDGPALGAVFREAGVVERVAPVWAAAEAFEPDEPHWYLRQIGVDPTLQGQGVGQAVMAASLETIDTAGGLAYLEATSAAGVRFYERHGFTTLGKVSINGSAPLWPMMRPRR